MPFQKGTSGNPRGRPRRGESLADLIRTEGDRKSHGKGDMVRRMWDLAAKPHDRPDIAIKAAEWIAKHAYSPLVDLGTPDGFIPTKVIIELHPGH